MPKRFPTAQAHLGVHIQTKVSQAASALSEILSIMMEHEGKVRKARGETRQDFLRGALRILSQLHIPSTVVEDHDLNLRSLSSLEQELESLGVATGAGIQEILSLSHRDLENIREQRARLEAVHVTLGRALAILQAPQQRPLSRVERLQFDLDARISSLQGKVGNMLGLLENTREAESSRFSSLRPQVEKALGLLHSAGVLPKKSARNWWQNEREVPTRNRLAGENRK